ncbi:MAG: hypothetical protein NZ942_03050 [Candidatus Aenigmarchaeota archaeon]|nr:hypothetical protein [Candidatus Aenigmarchaeota archaeon]
MTKTTEKMTKKAVKSKFVHIENFIVGKVKIDKKNVLNYIKGKSIPIFGDDYYYTYLYKNGYLIFLSTKSNIYLNKKIPIVAVSLLKPGVYYIKDKKGDFFHFIEHTEDNITHRVVFELPKNAVEINESFLKQYEKECASLKLKWSLEKKEYMYLIYTVFVFSLIFFVFMNAKANQLKQQVIANRNNNAAAIEKHYGNIDLSKYLFDISDSVLGKGVINKVEKTIDGLVFYISFKTEEHAQTFLKDKGGKYEQGQVIYATSFGTR